MRSYLNKQMHGDETITVEARLAITNGTGGQIDGMVKACAGFSGFTVDCEFSEDEYEVWECEIIIIPRRKYRNGPFKGYRIDQVLTGIRDLNEQFSECEIIK